MKYKEWLKEVPKEITNDTLWNMNVYRYGLFLSDVAWQDANQLSKNKLLTSSCDQLFRSAGSISEGYSIRSKLDQARFYEYALGSARECRGWYFKVRYNLDKKVLNSRLILLTEIIRMLLYIVPTNRGDKISEPNMNYLANDKCRSDTIENLEIYFPD